MVRRIGSLAGLAHQVLQTLDNFSGQPVLPEMGKHILAQDGIGNPFIFSIYIHIPQFKS
jgi:hypothetical protein